MLEGTSLKAREIGHIIVTGEKAGRDRELVSAADDIPRWASPRTRRADPAMIEEYAGS
jgi:hypothetical protein